jgi:hypothetical protein
MLAFVLNLKSRPERWENIQKRFDGTSVQVMRINAVRHRVGAYGNFLSFIRALRKAKAMKLPAVILMEDDCLPTPGWEKRWVAVQEWLDNHPESWDIYSGGVWQILEPVEIGRAGTRGEIVMYDPMWSVAAHWLYIPERSYDKLLSYYERVSGVTAVIPLAGINVHNNFFKTVTSYPFMAYQDSGFSDIQTRDRELENAFTQAEARLRKPAKKRGKTRKSRSGRSRRGTRKN